jgi:two-component system, NarL family, response regulator LiaR
LLFVYEMEAGTVVLQITPRERAALQLMADGKATHEIAGSLAVGEREVEAHLTTLFAKMGAASRKEAVSAAFRRGLLTVHD